MVTNYRNYDKEPSVAVDLGKTGAWQGYDAICVELETALTGKKNAVVAVECYPGVRKDEVVAGLAALGFATVLDTDRITRDRDELERMMAPNLTDDRVFGVMSHFTVEDFLDPARVETARQAVAARTGRVLVIGIGAVQVVPVPDVLVYADLARWEIQRRYRSYELANWCADNYDEDILRKYKRGFFVDWRVADRQKRKLFPSIAYWLDTNVAGDPKLATGDAVRYGLEKTATRPFRVVPFFDPGVWGGQWMKEICDLDRRQPNYAWCFDCVPEENSLYLVFGDVRVELPSIDLVFWQPKPLLGNKVHARFGAEFPIRFDFLDTMGGQNLSLQVHPLTEYIYDRFGMAYTQDESYYILDAEDGAGVYLGAKEDADLGTMFDEMEEAQQTGKFDAHKYVNCFPAKRHDHFLIPAGTLHCSGANTMVLEISATPFIFTFKLWDWDRLGLDGLPRPVSVGHGRHNVQPERRTAWVQRELVNRSELLGEGDGWREERTGLHEREFIETRRHWFTKPVTHHTHDGVQVLNLVQGEEAVVSSPSGAFEPFVVHYAETFIVPAAVGEYVIAPTARSAGTELATVKAYVRT